MGGGRSTTSPFWATGLWLLFLVADPQLAGIAHAHEIGLKTTYGDTRYSSAAWVSAFEGQSHQISQLGQGVESDRLFWLLFWKDVVIDERPSSTRHQTSCLPNCPVQSGEKFPKTLMEVLNDLADMDEHGTETQLSTASPSTANSLVQTGTKRDSDFVSGYHAGFREGVDAGRDESCDGVDTVPPTASVTPERGPTEPVLPPGVSYFARFGHLASCRQPIFFNKCGSCQQCTEPYMPPTLCDEVRELIVDALFSQYVGKCSESLDERFRTTVHRFTACEDSMDTVGGEAVRCNDGKVIKFTDFNFGRKSRSAMSECHQRMPQDIDDCVSGVGTDGVSTQLTQVRGICNDRASCHIDDHIFTDPCPGYSKYLEGTYKCVRDFTTVKGFVDSIVTAPSAGEVPSDLFKPSYMECLCAETGWERIVELCSQEAVYKGCKFCQIKKMEWWADNQCSSFMPEVKPENTKAVSSLALIVLVVMLYFLRPNIPKSAPEVEDVSRFDFEQFFGEGELDATQLAVQAHMDLYFAKALIKSVKGDSATKIDVNELFNTMDKRGEGWVEISDIRDGMFRNYPSEKAQKKAKNLVLMIAGKQPEEDEDDKKLKEELATMVNSKHPTFVKSNKGTIEPYKLHVAPGQRHKVPSSRYFSERVA